MVGSASSWSHRCPRRRQGGRPSPPTCSAPPTPSACPPALLCKTPASHHSSKCWGRVQDWGGQRLWVPEAGLAGHAGATWSLHQLRLSLSRQMVSSLCGWPCPRSLGPICACVHCTPRLLTRSSLLQAGPGPEPSRLGLVAVPAGEEDLKGPGRPVGLQACVTLVRGRTCAQSRGDGHLCPALPVELRLGGSPTFPSWKGSPSPVSLPACCPCSLQRPVHHVVPPSTVTEDYLRSFRPYHTAEDLRMSSLPPLGLDPATAAAYYHPSYLTPHPFPHPAFR